MLRSPQYDILLAEEHKQCNYKNITFIFDTFQDIFTDVIAAPIKYRH